PVLDKLGLPEKWSTGRQKLPEEQSYFKMLRMLDMREVRNTDLIEIGVYSTEPKEASDIANSIAFVYQDKRRSDQQKLPTQGLGQVQEEVAKQRKVVEEASNEAARIRIQQGIVDMNPEAMEAAETMDIRAVMADEQKADDGRVEVAKLKTQMEEVSQITPS